MTEVENDHRLGPTDVGETSQSEEVQVPNR
jgi:hypothetical protein